VLVLDGNLSCCGLRLLLTSKGKKLFKEKITLIEAYGQLPAMPEMRHEFTFIARINFY